jgi:Ca2+-binding RTX toxin-like protein
LSYRKKLLSQTLTSGTTPGADVLKGGAEDTIFTYGADGVWGGAWAQNGGDPGMKGSLELWKIDGYGRSYDAFIGQAGHWNRIVMPDGKHAIFLDDPYSPNGAGARLVNISEIVAGDGGQVIDLTTDRFKYGDITIWGHKGNDVLMSNAGNDHINAREGDDYVWGGSGNDKLDGGTGNDRVLGGNGDDHLLGNEGNDKVDGGDGNDFANGDRGDDVVNGGNGDDTVWGGEGNDQVYGDAGNDTMTGGKGDDKLWGGNGNDTMSGHSGADVLEGGAGDDKLMGDSENDQLSGGNGNDGLNGGTGKDILRGGLGDDALAGGSDADRFVWEKGDSFKSFDKIAGFAKGDVLDFSGLIDNGANNAAVDFVKFADGAEGIAVLAALFAGDTFHEIALLAGKHGYDVAQMQADGFLVI